MAKRDIVAELQRKHAAHGGGSRDGVQRRNYCRLRCGPVLGQQPPKATRTPGEGAPLAPGEEAGEVLRLGQQAQARVGL